MGDFRFRHFTVKNDRAAMRVNTDGVLLGACAGVLPSDKSVLDIGTGTGTIALMVAQRLAAVGEGFRITGIDIDGPSAAEAGENFASSPWGDCMRAAHAPLSGYEASLPTSDRQQEASAGLFDLIVSNPPYFESSLKSPDGRRREARHAETLSYRDILEFASRRLNASGRLSLIIPAAEEIPLLRHAASCGLYPFRLLRIRTVPRKQPSRLIAEFSRVRKADAVQECALTIQDKGAYTCEYRSLMSDFLIYV